MKLGFFAGLGLSLERIYYYKGADGFNIACLFLGYYPEAFTRHEIIAGLPGLQSETQRSQD